MIILLGSKNISKRRSVEMAFNRLGIKDLIIICVEAPSLVNSRPIGYEVIRGADNRNSYCKQFAQKCNIDYDYLISIEGGFNVNESGHPFVATYAIVEDKKGNKSTGKSMEIRIKREMFEYLRDKGSLNAVIEKITDSTDNKKSLGIMGWVSDGLLQRSETDSQAVISAMVPFVYKNRMEMIINEL